MAGWNQKTVRSRFFEDLEEPVAPAYVQQLVTGDGLLHVVAASPGRTGGTMTTGERKPKVIGPAMRSET